MRYGTMTWGVGAPMVILGIGSLFGLASRADGAEIEHQKAVARRVPLIYCTDLFHPHGDPDDHFDLATLFAMPELDIKAILLERGKSQKYRSGHTPVEQMFRLTGRRVPYAIGLSSKLQSPDDKGLNQPEEFQAGIKLMLKVLRESPEPAAMIFVGSTRDICAAFNREPELLREKVSRIYINMGSKLEGQPEWNEGVDPQAYIGLMRSGLPVYWCPCRPPKSGTAWVFKHEEVLRFVPPALLNWFIYALQRVQPDELDPMVALTMDLRPWRHLVMAPNRGMWCTASLIHAAGRRIYRVDDRWVAAQSSPPGGELAEVFTFVPAHVTITYVDERAHTQCTEPTSDPNMHVFKTTAPTTYMSAMKSCLRDLLHRFPVVLKAGYESK